MRSGWMGLALLAACGSEAPTDLLRPPSTATIRDGGSTTPPDAGFRDAGFRDGGFYDAGFRDAGFIDSGTPSTDIADWLAAQDDIIVDEAWDNPQEGTRMFGLRIYQPEDHDAPDGVGFWQRVVLRYRGQDRPMIVHTTGYDLFGDYFTWTNQSAEPVSLFATNEMVVEHRFFGTSIVLNSPTWSKMSVAQSAADTHRIRQRFGEFFGETWAGTGVSKGGMTAIFHHHHYPNDYAGIFPYVAPISFGTQDPRYMRFFETIGPPDGVCRDRILQIAEAMIVRRDELVDVVVARSPMLRNVDRAVVAAGIARTALTIEWSFWQSLADATTCASMPDVTQDPDAVLSFLWLDPTSLTNPQPSSVAPYYFQVAYELGAPGYSRARLLMLASGIDFGVLPSPPPPAWANQQPTFDPSVMRRVDRWLRNDAQNVIGIYGAWDPWTGGVPTVSPRNGSTLWIVDETGHRAQAIMLPDNERTAALQLMSGILRVPLAPSGQSVGGDSVRVRHQRVVDAALRRAMTVRP